MTGLGVATGDLVHTIFAAVGLSAVLMTSAFAFSAVKFIGAAYLIYLGIRATLERQADASLPKVSAVTHTKAFLQAVPAEALNPKTALCRPARVRFKSGHLFRQCFCLRDHLVPGVLGGCGLDEQNPALVVRHRVVPNAFGNGQEIATLHLNRVAFKFDPKSSFDNIKQLFLLIVGMPYKLPLEFGGLQ
jgi:hypothetical protein